MLSSLADGRSAIGPFRRFDGHDRVRIERELDHEGMACIVFVHDVTPASETAANTATTIACFSSRDLDVTGFVLEPASRSLGPFELAFAWLAVIALWIFRPLMARSSHYPQVEFPGRPEFASRYALRTPSPAAMLEILTPEALDFFEANPGWTVEGITGRLLVYRADVLEPPGRLAAFVREAGAVATRFRTPRS